MVFIIAASTLCKHKKNFRSPRRQLQSKLKSRRARLLLEELVVGLVAELVVNNKYYQKLEKKNKI